MNPQHCIPTINDNGFILWESRAILAYLVEKYAPDDSLYPKEPHRRGQIIQRLYFDMGVIYHRFILYYYPQIFDSLPENPENYRRMEEGLSILNSFLEGQLYVTGDMVTIADIALVSTIASYEAMEVDLSKFHNVFRWFYHIKKTVPGYEFIEAGVETYKKYISGAIAIRDYNHYC